MNFRAAAAIFGLLILAVVVGWCARPDTMISAAPETTVYIEATSTAPEGSAVTATAIILGFLIGGAALIGLFFFNPPTPKGPPARLSAISAGRQVLHDSRCGPAVVEIGQFWACPTSYPCWHEISCHVGIEKRRGLRVISGVPVSLLVQSARRGLAHLHQELEVVLGLLQTVDQQIDRLMRIQAGQYATQLVQHRRLVRVEQ